MTVDLFPFLFIRPRPSMLLHTVYMKPEKTSPFMLHRKPQEKRHEQCRPDKFLNTDGYMLLS
jgi:hypothetical protein